MNLSAVTIIGAGSVGKAFARALTYSGNPPAAIYSLNGKSAARLAGSVGTKMFGKFDHEIPLSGTVIIAVPDSEIKEVVGIIIRWKRSFHGMVFLHTSGGLTSDELLPLKKHGASIGSFHPLQTFSKSARATVVKDIYCAVEGDAGAVKRSANLARVLGMKYFIIRKKDKVLYHIAAVFASNYLVTIMSVAEQLSKHFGMPEKEYRKIVRPLVLQTVENMLNSSPAEALTGPIMRGDTLTIGKHLKALESTRILKNFLPLYAALGIETAHLAKRRK